MSPDQGRWLRDALPRDTIINSFRILRIIGRGGFGITYEAADHLDQRFAIKECYPRDYATRDGLEVVSKSAEDDEIFSDCRGRFLREAQALVQMGKMEAARDGVVRVVTFFEAHGTAYMVMELLSGRTLDDLITAMPGGIPSDQLRDLMQGVSRALDAVHQAGLLHRDLKPANIALRDDGRPVLIDFGAVRVSSQGQTTMYTKVYTSGYAPIEQVDGLEQGPMSDIYGFGATFYRAIGGTLQPAQDRDRAARRGNRDPQKPAIELGTGRYPTAVLKALDETLRVEPVERPQSVRDMMALMELSNTTLVDPRPRPKPKPDVQPPPPPSPSPVSPPESLPIPPASKPKPWPAIMGLAVVTVVALMGVIAFANGWLHFRAPSSLETQASGTPPASQAPAAAAPGAAAPPATAPRETTAPAGGPSSAQVDREQQTYNSARGSLSALRSYVNSCQVCAYKIAAQSEIQQLELADQERQTYAAGRGNASALRSYTSTCQVCESKLAAQSEIRQLDRIDQERQTYAAARGSASALRSYVNTCQACESKSDALSEIDRLDAAAAAPRERSETFCGRQVTYSLYSAPAGDIGSALVGVWAGQWSGGPTCAVMIVQRAPSSGRVEVGYQYQVKSGYIGRFSVNGSLDRGVLTFTDPDGGEFIFRFTDTNHLGAGFQRQSASLTGTFEKIR
jgi:serine/threonine protein kinase